MNDYEMTFVVLYASCKDILLNNLVAKDDIYTLKGLFNIETRCKFIQFDTNSYGAFTLVK